jgi:hypothetical protein
MGSATLGATREFGLRAHGTTKPVTNRVRSEGTTGRALAYAAGINGAQMTVGLCTAACKTAGYTLAGVEYSGECCKWLAKHSTLNWESSMLTRKRGNADCGNTIANGATIAADNGCTMLCNGNSSEICGGPSRLNVYDFNKPAASASSSSTRASTS